MKNFILEIKSSEVQLPDSYIKNSLNQKLWDGDSLNEDVRDQLLKISQEFYKYLNIPIEIKAIKLVGSMANYNWSNFSDIDVHLFFDFKDLDENIDLVTDFMWDKKELWKLNHHITVKGFDVELYAQDINAPFTSEGIYNLDENKWEEKPSKEKINVNYKSIQNKVKSIVDQIEKLEEIDQDKKAKKLYDLSSSLKDKIRNMRQSGLEKGGEFSVENLAFKYLRNKGYIDRLKKMVDETYDYLLSLK